MVGTTKPPGQPILLFIALLLLLKLNEKILEIHRYNKNLNTGTESALEA
jgi:hypothetical protein